MIDLSAAVEDIVSALTAAGIRAVDDERDVNPPCVLVSPPVLSDRTLGGAFTAQWSTWLIVGNTGRSSALRALSDLLDTVDVALGMKFVRGEPSDVLGTVDGAPLPGYLCTWTNRLPF